MASVSTHRNEPYATNLDLRPLSPIANGQLPSRRTTTPRPSISPLSTASKPHRSPQSKRDALVLDISPSRSDFRNGALHGDDESGAQHDDRSSSLSEPDDDAEEDELNDDVGLVGVRMGGHFTQRSLEVDSEAETERLEATPQKSRRHIGNIGKTPTKLAQALSPDQTSPVLSHPDIVSASISESFTGHKRKRSESIESPLSSAASDVGESPRKRIHESSEEIDRDAGLSLTGTNGFMEDASREDEVDDEVDDLAVDDTIQMPARKTLKGRKGKYKTRKALEHQDDALTPAEDGVEGDEDLGNENMAKTEEESQDKNQAMELFEDLARQFTSFKEKLYVERLEGLATELHMLGQPICEHPEYLRQVSAIDARMEKQTREAHASFRYRLQSLRERILAERSQMHSQYFQEVREIRERTMNHLGEDWYNIQKERRQSHQEKDAAYIFRFPTQKSTQIRHQAKYNHEVSILSGVAKYVGFPAAPELHGALDDMLESDLKAMKIPRRAAQPVVHPRAVLFNRDAASAIAQSERLAHEQYLEQNAWARPQAPIQQHGTPNLTHTPDWADLPGQTRNVTRNAGNPNQHSTTDSFTTPAAQRTALLETPNSEAVPLSSDGHVPSSSMQPVPPSSNRSLQYRGGSIEQASPINPPKQRHTTSDVGNFRNFSNLSRVSGASTIDAPSESDRERDLQDYTPLASKTLSQHPPNMTKESLGTVGSQGKEGAFGTPAPLMSTSK